MDLLKKTTPYDMTMVVDITLNGNGEQIQIAQTVNYTPVLRSSLKWWAEMVTFSRNKATKTFQKSGFGLYSPDAPGGQNWTFATEGAQMVDVELLLGLLGAVGKAIPSESNLKKTKRRNGPTPRAHNYAGKAGAGMKFISSIDAGAPEVKELFDFISTIKEGSEKFAEALEKFDEWGEGKATTSSPQIKPYPEEVPPVFGKDTAIFEVSDSTWQWRTNNGNDKTSEIYRYPKD